MLISSHNVHLLLDIPKRFVLSLNQGWANFLTCKPQRVLKHDRWAGPGAAARRVVKAMSFEKDTTWNLNKNMPFLILRTVFSILVLGW